MRRTLRGIAGERMEQNGLLNPVSFTCHPNVKILYPDALIQSNNEILKKNTDSANTIRILTDVPQVFHPPSRMRDYGGRAQPAGPIHAGQSPYTKVMYDANRTLDPAHFRMLRIPP
jgi:hypothetical protein